MWKLFVDGASRKGQYRAGTLLVSLEEVEVSYALRFSFETTNNETGYEALYVGLIIAHQMEVENISVS